MSAHAVIDLRTDATSRPMDEMWDAMRSAELGSAACDRNVSLSSHHNDEDHFRSSGWSSSSRLSSS